MVAAFATVIIGLAIPRHGVFAGKTMAAGRIVQAQGTVTDVQPSFREETVEILIELVKMWEGEEPPSVRVEAVSRGAESTELAMPIFSASARQSVLAGARPFHLAWVGGRPPFSVELAGENAGPVRWNGVTERRVGGAIPMQEGFYEVRVTDAAGRSVRGMFKATAQSPAVDRRGIGELPPDLGNALLAARLADVDEGAWRLEAYERLTAAPDGEASRVTADRLARGLSVSELRNQGDPRR